MTQTLKQLQSGELAGIKQLKLACGLKDFPEEIFELADTLEVLDLSDNKFSTLPSRMQELKKLRIVFFANNDFTVFPQVLAQCAALTMIGFKANKLKIVPENAFPPLLQWLILTDNEIEQLPASIGKCHFLQKCALAGNKIKSLPSEMANCTNLELLRIAANELEVLPNWLFELPKLSWVAFGGNTSNEKPLINTPLVKYNWSDFEIKQLLGEGASGHIYQAKWSAKNRDVAIKVFKGSVTSDGLPKDEMNAAIIAGNHAHLVEVLGEITNHPDGKSALILKLISPDYVNLGNPPSLQTCTRDVFEKKLSYTPQQLSVIATSIASVCAQLHSKGINHGDLYAHNIMINPNSQVLLGDFGAASFYKAGSVQAKNIERVEVRAFGCLIEDVFKLVNSIDFEEDTKQKWQLLIDDCLRAEVLKRPSFKQIFNQLQML